MSPCATFFPGLCLCLWVVVGGDLALLAQPKLVAVSCFSPGERSSSGLLEWDSKSDALETLGFLNHYQMKNPSECLVCPTEYPWWLVWLRARAFLPAR